MLFIDKGKCWVKYRLMCLVIQNSNMEGIWYNRQCFALKLYSLLTEWEVLPAYLFVLLILPHSNDSQVFLRLMKSKPWDDCIGCWVYLAKEYLLIGCLLWELAAHILDDIVVFMSLGSQHGAISVVCSQTSFEAVAPNKHTIKKKFYVHRKERWLWKDTSVPGIILLSVWNCCILGKKHSHYLACWLNKWIIEEMHSILRL